MEAKARRDSKDQAMVLHARCWDRSAVLRERDAWKLALVCSVPTVRVTLREASSLQSPLHYVLVELARACQNETVRLQQWRW